MFGKGNKSKPMGATMVRGINAGNLKGNGSADKTAPMAKGSPMSLPSYRNITEAMGPSKGKAGPVKIT